MKLIYASILCSITILLTGCQATGSTSSSWNPLTKLKNKPVGPPSRVVAIWAPDVLNTQGQRSTQGFGGRIYFYDANNQTIPVDGQLIIHAYDDSEGADHTNADKKFVFTPEQLKRHHGQSELGDSYSIWIPWQPVGGMQRRISLVPTFTSTTGLRVVGHQTMNLLPGKKPRLPETKQEEVAAHERKPGSNRGQAGAILPTDYPSDRSRGTAAARTLDYTTTTINVPRSLSEQMRSQPGTSPVLPQHKPGRTPAAGGLPAYPQSAASALPQATPAVHKPTTEYRPAWVPYGTPLSGPTPRRGASSSTTVTSPQIP